MTSCVACWAEVTFSRLSVIGAAASLLLPEKQVKFSLKASLSGGESFSQRNMDEDVLTTLKLLIIGESGVGKSRSVSRLQRAD